MHLRQTKVREWRDAVADTVLADKDHFLGEWLMQMYNMIEDDGAEHTQALVTDVEWAALKQWSRRSFHLVSPSAKSPKTAADVDDGIWGIWSKCQRNGLWAGTVTMHALAIALNQPVYVAIYSTRGHCITYGKALPRAEHRVRTRDGAQLAGAPTVWYRGLSGAELVAEMRELKAPKRPASCGTQAAAGAKLGVAIYNGSNHYERGDMCLKGALVSIEWEEKGDFTWCPGNVTEERYSGSTLQQKVEYLGEVDDNVLHTEWVDFDDKDLRFDVVRTGQQHANSTVAAPIGGELVPSAKK
jgi:hypothetical protein